MFNPLFKKYLSFKKMSARCPFLTSYQTHRIIFSPKESGWNLENLDLSMPDYFGENNFFEFGINFEQGQLEYFF
jgi:hypothetical protein